MNEIPAGLKDWARLAGPAVVLAAVRDRAARGAATETGDLRIALTHEQRREVGRLLGKPWEMSGKPLRLQILARALADHGLSVREFIEGLDGAELVNLRVRRAEERTSAQEAAAAERDAAGKALRVVGVEDAAAETWILDQGLPRAGTGELLALAQRVAAVWQHLPAQSGSIPLAQLAARVADHNAHALDFKDPLGRAVVRLIAAQYRVPRPTRGGRIWRQTWAYVGVKCDGVSSRVLVLNLPLAGDSPAARWSAASAGEPLWLTLRSLPAEWSVHASATVFVCENVTVVEAAADRLGPECPPMICTDGYPANAALDVIAGLSEVGCRFKIRADFDADGLAIVEQIRSVAPSATGWRYDAATYARALQASVQADDHQGGFDELQDRYRQHGIPIHEESLLDALVEDLRAHAHALATDTSFA